MLKHVMFRQDSFENLFYLIHLVHIFSGTWTNCTENLISRLYFKNELFTISNKQKSIELEDLQIN